MFGLLWDLHQQGRIDQNARDLGSVRSESNALQRRLDDLRRQVEALSLTCMAMWSLLQGETGVTDAQLAERVREIHLRDGKLDGRARPGAQTCASCGRVMSPRHTRCMCCGSSGFSVGG